MFSFLKVHGKYLGELYRSRERPYINLATDQYLKNNNWAFQSVTFFNVARSAVLEILYAIICVEIFSLVALFWSPANILKFAVLAMMVVVALSYSIHWNIQKMYSDLFRRLKRWERVLVEAEIDLVKIGEMSGGSEFNLKLEIEKAIIAKMDCLTELIPCLAENGEVLNDSAEKYRRLFENLHMATEALYFKIGPVYPIFARARENNSAKKSNSV